MPQGATKLYTPHHVVLDLTFYTGFRSYTLGEPFDYNVDRFYERGRQVAAELAGQNRNIVDILNALHKVRGKRLTKTTKAFTKLIVDNTPEWTKSRDTALVLREQEIRNKRQAHAAWIRTQKGK